MAELGKLASLTINRLTDFGFFLDGEELGEILMPKRYITPDMKIGDKVDVFIFLDGEERIVATTDQPIAQVGEFAYMKVSKVETIGAFLHWGVTKELLVPFSEQKIKMEEGKSYVVFVYIDKLTERPTASMKLEKYLSKEPAPYQVNEEVDLLIWTKTDFGHKAIINNRYQGVLYQNETFKRIATGQNHKGYIKKIREDGKIDLSLEPIGYERIDDHASQIMDILSKAGGHLPYNDKTDPEVIYKIFHMSKKAFKQAIGNLFKHRLIIIDKNGISISK
ncbi:MAG: S1-like domain-containing RNA-binding protein [Saprospiraceae bacterium]